MSAPYDLSAKYYDRIYAAKDYGREASALCDVISRHGVKPRALLEVGCGTGGHLAALQEWFEVEGVDLSQAMLEVARKKVPNVRFHHGDMRSFKLDRGFDVVSSLFSSIGYVRSIEELDRTVANLANHLNAGGLLIVEPWFTPEQWQTPGRLQGGMLVDEPEFKLARFHVGGTEGRFAVMPMHHLLGEANGVTHFVEHHELLLATTAEYEQAFVNAGLQGVVFEPDALPRGAWIGRAA